MTYRGSESIRGIVRRRYGFKLEKHLYHHSYLLLFGISVPHDCLLDEPWSVFSDFKPSLLGEYKYYAPNLAQLDGDRRVLSVERIFQRKNIWFEAFDHVRNAVVHGQQAL